MSLGTPLRQSRERRSHDRGYDEKLEHHTPVKASSTDPGTMDLHTVLASTDLSERQGVRCLEVEPVSESEQIPLEKMKKSSR